MKFTCILHLQNLLQVFLCCFNWTNMIKKNFCFGIVRGVCFFRTDSFIYGHCTASKSHSTTNININDRKHKHFAQILRFALFELILIKWRPIINFSWLSYRLSILFEWSRKTWLLLEWCESKWTINFALHAYE